MKRIPKSFRLGAHEITVKVVSAEEMTAVEESEPLGLWVAQELTIYIQKARRGLRKEVQLHTFWHEFYHALFWCLGRMAESDDEILVDQCGLLTMQAIQTAKH
jgi:hypothetical protein